MKDQGCKLPPAGWYCSREPGHDGPCAAYEKGSLPERDETKPAEKQGLFRKFNVSRTDGNDVFGTKHYGCEYYVLDLDHDVAAPHAMRAYANAVRATHPLLAQDIDHKFGWGSTVEMPFAIKDDVLRYVMEVVKMNNPDGARHVKAVYHAIRDALLHPVGDNGDGACTSCGRAPGERRDQCENCPIPDTETLAGQTWQAPPKLNVVKALFGKQPCADLSAQLRAMADAVDRGEIVEFVAAYTQHGEYETFYASALDQSLVLASLLHRRCVDRFFVSE